jgi:multidrug efflux pump subunit AcrA (membrane-fusion protein)
MKKTYIFIIALSLVACGKPKEEKAINPPLSANKINAAVVVGIGSIEPIDRIVQLTTESGGVVREIDATVSQSVQQGQLLFRLSDEVETAQVQQAQTKLITQDAVIESQRATVGSLVVQVQNARVNLERTLKLFAGKAATQQQLDEGQFAFDNVSQQKMAAESNLAQQVARRKEMQADLAYARALLGRKHIVAPSNGKILSIDAKIGSFINPGISLGEFAPEGALVAITEIDELFADRVKIGQHAFFRPQGDTIVLGRGDVFLVSPYLKKKSLFSDNSSNLEDRRVREVRIHVAADAQVLIGSRVECVIEIK